MPESTLTPTTQRDGTSTAVVDDSGEGLPCATLDIIIRRGTRPRKPTQDNPLTTELGWYSTYTIQPADPNIPLPDPKGTEHPDLIKEIHTVLDGFVLVGGDQTPETAVKRTIETLGEKSENAHYKEQMTSVFESYGMSWVLGSIRAGEDRVDGIA